MKRENFEVEVIGVDQGMLIAVDKKDGRLYSKPHSKQARTWACRQELRVLYFKEVAA